MHVRFRRPLTLLPRLRRVMRNGLILVDAYNGACLEGTPTVSHLSRWLTSAHRPLITPVINKWPKCAVHFAVGNLAAAREALITEVLGYAAFRGTLGTRHTPGSDVRHSFVHSLIEHSGAAHPGCVLRQRCESLWLVCSSVRHHSQNLAAALIRAGIKVVIVFDATTSAQSEAQRESLSEHVDVVFSAGGARALCCLHPMFRGRSSACYMQCVLIWPPGTAQELEQRTSSLKQRSGRLCR